MVQVVDGVQAQEDGVGLPVDLVLPRQRHRGAVGRLRVHDHDHARPHARREVVGHGDEVGDDIGVHTGQVVEHGRPRAPERIRRLERGRDRRARRPVAGEQLAELVARRAMRLHHVVGDLVQAPLRRPRPARGVSRLGAAEELLEVLEGLRHAAADGGRWRQRTVVTQVVVRACAQRRLHLRGHHAHRHRRPSPGVHRPLLPVVRVPLVAAPPRVRPRGARAPPPSGRQTSWPPPARGARPARRSAGASSARCAGRPGGPAGRYAAR